MGEDGVMQGWNGVRMGLFREGIGSVQGYAGKELGEDGVMQGRNWVRMGLCREGMG
jgi:hypothetical protein